MQTKKTPMWHPRLLRPLPILRCNHCGHRSQWHLLRGQKVNMTNAVANAPAMSCPESRIIATIAHLESRAFHELDDRAAKTNANLRMQS